MYKIINEDPIKELNKLWDLDNLNKFRSIYNTIDSELLLENNNNFETLWESLNTYMIEDAQKCILDINDWLETHLNDNNILFNKLLYNIIQYEFELPKLSKVDVFIKDLIKIANKYPDLELKFIEEACYDEHLVIEIFEIYTIEEVFNKLQLLIKKQNNSIDKQIEELKTKKERYFNK